MRDVHPREVQIYQTVGGREPFTEWLKSIQDISTQDRIKHDLSNLNMVISETTDPLVEVFLNYVFTSEQVIGFILDRWVQQLFSCSMVAISRRKRAILNAQKLIGCNTKGRIYEKNENIGRVPHRSAC